MGFGLFSPILLGIMQKEKSGRFIRFILTGNHPSLLLRQQAPFLPAQLRSHMLTGFARGCIK